MGARLCLSVNFPNTNVTAACQLKSYDDDDDNDDGDDDDYDDGDGDYVVGEVLLCTRCLHCDDNEKPLCRWTNF